MAIAIDGDSEDVSVVGNVFRDISSTAIQVGDVSGHDDESRVARRVTVADNQIAQTATEYLDAVGIFVGYAIGATITHNVLSDLPYTAISVGWGWDLTPRSAARDNDVSYNRITNFMHTLSDGGGVYTLGPQPGSRIHHNYLERQTGTVGGALYLDEGTAFYEVRPQRDRLRSALAVHLGSVDRKQCHPRQLDRQPDDDQRRDRQPGQRNNRRHQRNMAGRSHGGHETSRAPSNRGQCLGRRRGHHRHGRRRGRADGLDEFVRRRGDRRDRELGDASLFIPPGALPADGTITMTIVPSAGLPETATLASAVYDLTPDGLRFNKKATLTLPLSRAVPADKQAELSWIDTGSTNWTALTSTASANQAVAETDHFTRFAVRLVPKRATPTGKMLINGSVSDLKIYEINLAGGEATSRVNGRGPCLTNEGTVILEILDSVEATLDGAQKRVIVKYDGDSLSTRHDKSFENPQVSPEGTRVAYISRESLFVVNRASGELVASFLIQATSEAYERPTWTPDGRIVRRGRVRQPGAPHHGCGPHDHHALRSDDGSSTPARGQPGRQDRGVRAGEPYLTDQHRRTGIRQLTTSSFDEKFPFWSPDGKWLAMHGQLLGHRHPDHGSGAGGRQITGQLRRPQEAPRRHLRRQPPVQLALSAGAQPQRSRRPGRISVLPDRHAAGRWHRSLSDNLGEGHAEDRSSGWVCGTHEWRDSPSAGQLP